MTDKPRLKLAEWIVDPANPLTARVMVNRIWQYHFGRGIVATPNDFGRMGTRPSNPDLLDWLASQFVEGGWKMKPMHRMILLVERLPAVQQFAHRERRRGEGFGGRAAVEVRSPAPGSGRDPRLHAGRFRRG